MRLVYAPARDRIQAAVNVCRQARIHRRQFNSTTPLTTVFLTEQHPKVRKGKIGLLAISAIKRGPP
jgi:hypothetical protein